MPAYAKLPEIAVVTGAAGFIGSHLVEALLQLGVTVRGLDNLSTGTTANLDSVRERVGDSWRRFEFINGDVRFAAEYEKVLRGSDAVFHQAAMNSVPRSIEMPVFITDNNVIGMAALLQAAVDAKVPRFLYASSSSVYGNIHEVIRSESHTGAPLSPYAASKQAVEAYASCYQQLASIEVTGLRYFNVFGSRQNDKGPYSAVIPRWIRALLNGDAIHIYGDGEQRRDFTHVSNVVHANLIAYGCAAAGGETFNVGTGTSVSLLELFDTIRFSIIDHTGRRDIASRVPIFQEERQGDVRAALADITKIRRTLGYEPMTDLATGIDDTVLWLAKCTE